MSGLKSMCKKMISIISAAILSICCIINFPIRSSGEEQVDMNALVKEMTILVNDARAEFGLNPVYLVPYLCDVANVRARECIVTFSHTRPDGQKFSTALDMNLVPCTKVSENIAAGTSDAQIIFENWKNSPKHWNTIINPQFTHIGIGLCYEPNSEFKWYWEQFFVAYNGDLQGQQLIVSNKIIPKSSGDINGDGEINSFDYIAINKYLRNELPLNDKQIESADVMKDGTITSADAAILKKYILGECDALPYTFN